MHTSGGRSPLFLLLLLLLSPAFLALPPTLIPLHTTGKGEKIGIKLFRSDSPNFLPDLWHRSCGEAQAQLGRSWPRRSRSSDARTQPLGDSARLQHTARADSRFQPQLRCAPSAGRKAVSGRAAAPTSRISLLLCKSVAPRAEGSVVLRLSGRRLTRASRIQHRPAVLSARISRQSEQGGNLRPAGMRAQPGRISLLRCHKHLERITLGSTPPLEEQLRRSSCSLKDAF